MANWSSAGMKRVAEVVRSRTGLVFPSSRAADVEATVRRSMARRGIADMEQLLSLLHESADVRDALVAELTVGETYFLRDAAQFGLLRERVIPELLAARPSDRPVRVWSAGCASGEEPYTVAMLFDELNLTRRAHIVGTDISRPRLAHAQRGIYSQWSLRSTPPEVRARYFRQRGRYVELTSRIRGRVDFRYLNLAEDTFPSLSIGIWGMDIILCRNVLIYFDAATVAQVARRLIATLGEDGWLILGASDPPLAELVECDVMMTDMGVVYRRPGAAGDADLRRMHGYPRSVDAAAAPSESAADVPVPPRGGREAAPDSPGPAATTEDALPGLAPAEAGRNADAGEGAAGAAVEPEALLLDAFAQRDFERVDALAASLAAEGMSERAWVAWLRALANRGCLEQAAEVVTMALAACGPTAELLYLHAVLLLQEGRARDAVEAARRSLYLDSGMAVAHLTLATARERAGDVGGARRALRNAAQLLERMPATAEVPGSDGESAGRLAELVRVKRRLLHDAA